MYKTPIVPSRYKDIDAIPAFLRTTKAHVPIPMPKKDRKVKPSLGLPAPEESKRLKKSSRHTGKPYGQRGGISKVIEKRKAEEEEERFHEKRKLEVVDEDDEMDTDAAPSKRDVGVSTGRSGSEDERTATQKDVYASKASEIGTMTSSSMEDPFKQQKASPLSGGRTQPYGRIGRTRVRDPGSRSVPLGRSSNRFSAAFDDDDEMESTKVDTSFDETSSTRTKTVGVEAPAFEAPEGFSFAQDVSITILFYSLTLRCVLMSPLDEACRTRS